MFNNKFINIKGDIFSQPNVQARKHVNNSAKKSVQENSTNLAIVWTKSEYQQLKKRAHVITKEERMLMRDEIEKQKNLLQEESNKRKEVLKKIQLQHKSKPDSKLLQIEDEATTRNLYVLQRALELQQERDDEVKKANGLILATKCLAVREAQIAEQKIVKNELLEENRRLDLKMEQERIRALEEEEYQKQVQTEKIKNYMKEVSRQIRGNELQKLLEAESKAQEIHKTNKALVAMQQKNAEELQQKQIQQQKIKEELNICNAEMERYKLLKEKEQKIADLRIQEFMQKKAQREATKDLQSMEENLAKEREIARLRIQQQKVQDQQAIVDEMNSLRIQEEVERQWRRKEKMSAQKRKQQAAEMKKGREQQVEDLRRMRALEIERDEQESRQVAIVQKELYLKELEKKHQQKEAAIQHRNDLLQQMREKETERINEYKQKFDDGVALQVQQQTYNQQIENLVRKRVQKLKDNNIPERYIKEIERQLKLTQK